MTADGSATMLAVAVVTGVEPISGWVSDGAETRGFDGWLELFALLGDLAGASHRGEEAPVLASNISAGQRPEEG